jgi:uncharacterized membrane protein
MVMDTTKKPTADNAAKLPGWLVAMGYVFLLALCVAGWVLIDLASTWSFNSRMIRQALTEYAVVASADDPWAKQIQAGAVAHAYMMAGNKEEYGKWKEIESKWKTVVEQPRRR